MTPADLDAIAARAEAATPGPWAETWRPVVGCNAYEVSDFGNVRSYMRGGNHREKRAQDWRLLKQTNSRGYRTVSLPSGGSYSHRSVHALVMEAFVGPRPSGQEIAHLNGDPSDNRLSNLKYCTHVENEAHKRDHGTLGVGDKNANAKLQGWQAAEIKYLASKSIPQGKIAALFDMNHQDVSAIVNGGSWAETEARSDVPALLAEVTRLRGLIKDAEINGGEWPGDCPWCGANASEGHSPDCEAFLPSGEVR